ncbi:hypothetical protein OF83DRAFT_1080136 [Amylostereum chailletii]|nr:hypothetical protein OF83DRAFT_1080136 [Amylostereum chailletii]
MYLDQALARTKRRCYVIPKVVEDPRDPDHVYLEYGVRAQNYQDVDAFWREFETLKLPETEYDALLQAWERTHLDNVDAHPFLPRKYSMYAFTSEPSQSTGMDIPLGAGIPTEHYVQSRRDQVDVEPWRVNTLPVLTEDVSFGIAPTDAEDTGAGWVELPAVNEELFEAGYMNEDQTFGCAFEESDNDIFSISLREMAPLPQQSPTPSLTSSSSRSCSPSSYANTPLITAGRSLDPVARSPSPASEDFDEESDDEYVERRVSKSSKRTAQTSAKKTSKRSKTRHVSEPLIAQSSAGPLDEPSSSHSVEPSSSTSPRPSATAAILIGSHHPPLPAAANSRGRWECPYPDCIHDTGAIGDLIRHLESLAHQPEKKHRCKVCQCTFTRVDALKRHQMRRPERCQRIAKGLEKP